MSLNIVVTVKEVNDPAISGTELRTDEAGTSVVSRVARARIMNGYDENAVAAAVRIRTQQGGVITAVSFGPPTAVETLRRAIAMGCDKAVHIVAPSGQVDASTTATALAAAIRRLPPSDLVLSGRQASDTNAGNVFIGIAAMLQWPAITPVMELSISGDRLTAKRLTDEGYELLETCTPAVLGISSESNEPRYPPLNMLFKAARTTIPSWTMADLGLDETRPHTQIRHVSLSTAVSSVVMVDGGSATEKGRRLAERLWEEGLL